MSAGLAAGRARVVRTDQEAAAAAPGEILVLRSLAADLTGALAHAAGVVAEHGGPLSNGATLARELGIPVVLLEGATSLLRTGDLVSLDGARGSGEVALRRGSP